MTTLIQGPAVVVVATGGIPVTDLGANGAAPFTVDPAVGVAVTLVTSGGLPVSLLNPDGTFYAGGGVYSPSLVFSDARNSQYVGQVV